MKTRIVILVLLLSPLSFILSPCLAQIPQGFTYQAIALDATSKTPLKNVTLQIKILLLSDTVTNTVIWEELHNPVPTNNFGLFSLIIGTGEKQSGSVQTFSDIDWAKSPVYIRTQIYFPSSWKTLSAAQLWSVPYSMVANKLDGAVNKLEVVGDDVSSDEALFEVKRKDGETMFAVYNHGVRVYMPLDTLSKARKGGFAIGGFSKTKGTIQDYFVVNPDSIRAYIDANPDKARKGGFAIGSFDKTKATNQDYLTVNSDSVRIYIDTTQAKARKGGFAIGGFSKAKGGNASFFNVSPDATENIDPAKNKILWYPLKNAFLTGRVLIEKPDSVGVNSFASGYESKAIGDWSQALGYKAIARGDYSTAIGKNAVANKVNTFAFGENAQARNEESYAFGRGAIASGYRSFAFGSAGVDFEGKPTEVARALGDYSFAIGQGSRSTGKGAFSIGIADTASGDFSVALGHLASSGGGYSVAIGLYSDASGGVSTSIGYQSIAKGYASTALGSYARAIENWSVAIGYETFATGFNATAIGCKAIASGWISSSIGFESNSKGTISTAMGNGTIAVGDYSTSLGNFTLAKPTSSLAIGQYNDTTCSASGSGSWVTTDPIFIIGNGTSDDIRSNALTVLKNGNVGITAINPTQKLEITGTNSKIYLNSATSNSMLFNTNGVAPPSFSTRSYGTKIILYPSLSSSNADYAIGIDNNTFWYSIPTASSLFSYKFYAGTTELVRINGIGNVGIGTATPSYKLDVNGEISSRSYNAFRLRQPLYSIIMRNDNDNFYILLTNDNDPDGIWNTKRPFILKRSGELLLGNEGSFVGIGTYSPGYKLQVGNLGDGTQARANAWNLLSDARYKTNLVRVEDALMILESINGYYFNWNTGIDKSRHIGLLAQEVEKVLPEVVSQGQDGILSLDYGKITPLLVEAIKEQQQQIESYKSENDNLRSQLRSLQEKVDQIEALLAKEGLK